MNEIKSRQEKTMSLEQQLGKLTTAIEAQTALLAQLAAGQQAGAKATSAKAETKTEKPAAASKETKKAVKEAEPETADTLDYDTEVKPLVLQVVKDKGRPAIGEVFEQLGIENAIACPPERYQELVDACNKALAPEDEDSTDDVA